MSKPTPQVRVIVVNYNSGPWLARCLESLRVQSLADFEAVVVDNASTDGSLQLPADDVRFGSLISPQNLGFAAGNNRGAAGAQAPWLALLNPDAEAAPDWLEQLLAAAARHPQCVIFGSTQLRADDPGILDGTGDCLSAYGLAWRSGYGHPRPAQLPEGGVLAACGAALLIRRDWFERLGGFEERFFCYVEDVDLCLRARLLGAQVWQCAGAQVQHAGGVSSRRAPGAFAAYHGYRNLAWMLMRCLPRALLPIALCGYLALVAIKLVQAGTPEQREALRRARRDGLAGWKQIRPQRHHIQRNRVVTWRQVASWLSWNPAAALRRDHVAVNDPAPKREPRMGDG